MPQRRTHLRLPYKDKQHNILILGYIYSFLIYFKLILRFAKLVKKNVKPAKMIGKNDYIISLPFFFGMKIEKKSFI
jgi:hypothetical protein